MSQVYKLIRDEKVTTWIRKYIEVTASSIKEAAEFALNGNYNEDRKECLYHTAELLDFDDNDNLPTIEIYSEDYFNPIVTNK